MVFLMTPGGELNHKQIRLDFDATEWLFFILKQILCAVRKVQSHKVAKCLCICCNAPFVTKKPSGIGKSNVTKKHPKLCIFHGV